MNRRLLIILVAYLIYGASGILAVPLSSFYLVRQNGEVMRVADTKVMWLSKKDMHQIRLLRNEFNTRNAQLVEEFRNSKAELIRLEQTKALWDSKLNKLIIKSINKKNTTRDRELSDSYKRIKELKYLLSQERDRAYNELLPSYQLAEKEANRKFMEETTAAKEKRSVLREQRIRIGNDMIALFRELAERENYPLNEFILTEDPSVITTLIPLSSVYSGTLPQELVSKGHIVKKQKVFASYVRPRIQLFFQDRKRFYAQVSDLVKILVEDKIIHDEYAVVLAQRANQSDYIPTDSAVEARMQISHNVRKLKKELSAEYENIKIVNMRTDSDHMLRTTIRTKYETQWARSEAGTRFKKLKMWRTRNVSEKDLTNRLLRDFARNFIRSISSQFIRTDVNGEFHCPVDAICLIGYYRNSSIGAYDGWFEWVNSGEPVTFTTSNTINASSAYSLNDFAAQMVGSLITGNE